MQRRTLVATGIGAVAIALVTWWAWRTPPVAVPLPTPAAARRIPPDESIVPPRPAAPVAPDPLAVDEAIGTQALGDDGDPAVRDIPRDIHSDLDFYANRPAMSEVPHTVVRGWGARGGGRIPGLVGVHIVVDPDISDSDLERLALDVRDYHSDAKAVSVRILDSERASTYDRHTDGGALAAEHLVAIVNRNDAMGTDKIQIRDRVLDITELE